MFLNSKKLKFIFISLVLNRKHEMFLNKEMAENILRGVILTVNMKCF